MQHAIQAPGCFVEAGEAAIGNYIQRPAAIEELIAVRHRYEPVQVDRVFKEDPQRGMHIQDAGDPTKLF